MRFLVMKDGRSISFSEWEEFRDGVILLIGNYYANNKCYLVSLSKYVDEDDYSDNLVKFYDNSYGPWTKDNFNTYYQYAEIMEIYHRTEIEQDVGLLRYWRNEFHNSQSMKKYKDSDDAIIILQDGLNSYFCGIDKHNCVMGSKDISKAIRYQYGSSNAVEIMMEIMRKTGRFSSIWRMSDVILFYKSMKKNT